MLQELTCGIMEFPSVLYRLCGAYVFVNTPDGPNMWERQNKSSVRGREGGESEDGRESSSEGGAEGRNTGKAREEARKGGET